MSPPGEPEPELTAGFAHWKVFACGAAANESYIWTVLQFHQLWFIQGCNSIKKEIIHLTSSLRFPRRSRSNGSIGIAGVAHTCVSLSCTAEGDNSLLPVSKPPVKHKPHLRNSVMTSPPPFFFLLQLSTQTCKNYRQLTRPSTPGVFRRWNTVIISQQKYLFQSPYLQKKKQNNIKQQPWRFRVCVWVISPSTLWSFSTWMRVRGWGAAQLYFWDIFHCNLSSQSAKDSFCSAPGISPLAQEHWKSSFLSFFLPYKHQDSSN